jgi:hypothetical protein
LQFDPTKTSGFRGYCCDDQGYLIRRDPDCQYEAKGPSDLCPGHRLLRYGKAPTPVQEVDFPDEDEIPVASTPSNKVEAKPLSVKEKQMQSKRKTKRK